MWERKKGVTKVVFLLRNDGKSTEVNLVLLRIANEESRGKFSRRHIDDVSPASTKKTGFHVS